MTMETPKYIYIYIIILYYILYVYIYIYQYIYIYTYLHGAHANVIVCMYVILCTVCTSLYILFVML